MILSFQTFDLEPPMTCMFDLILNPVQSFGVTIGLNSCITINLMIFNNDRLSLAELVNVLYVICKVNFISKIAPVIF